MLRARHATDDARASWTELVLFAVIALLMALDVGDDVRAGAGSPHVAVELVVMALALVGAGLLVTRMLALGRRAEGLSRDVVRLEREAARWRGEAQEHLLGLGEAIDQQFARWALTPAEREVAMLLLKGLSSRAIAEVRETSERTVRQQALAIYRKAGLAGRAELAAFFLEDLLLPPASRGPA